MNVVLNTTQIVELLGSHKLNEQIVFARYPEGKHYVLDPAIDTVLKSLERNKQVLRFRKRASNSNQVTLIAVVVTPDLNQKITTLVKRYDKQFKKEQKVQPEVDVEHELMQVFG